MDLCNMEEASKLLNDEDDDNFTDLLYSYTDNSDNGIILSSSNSSCSTILSSPTAASSSSSAATTTTTTIKNNNIDISLCLRFHRFITRNWYLNYLLPVTILIIIICLMYFFRNFAKTLLLWIEHQNPWIIFSVFMFMFVLVSFPITIGYLILIITSGYLFGCVKGILTVILGANLGVAIAHNTIRNIKNKLPVHRLIKNETARAILQVISGPRAFKVVMFTRLTPIPFGLQNTIFGVSSVNPRSYHTGTLIGLLPAQIINVYLGSTLRSMHDVLNNHNTALTGYIGFSIEVMIGIGLMIWVIQKAKHELSEALLSDIGTDHKIVQV